MARAAGFSLRLLAGSLGLALFLVGAGVAAQAKPAGLPAVINVGSSGLDATVIQHDIEAELGVRLEIDPSAAERLEIALTARRANVTYYPPGRDPVTRSLELPKDPERARQTIAFLVGNLARDEASELLRQLAPTPVDATAEAAAAPPPPPPPRAPPVSEQEAATAKATPKPAPVRSPAADELLSSERFAANVSLYHPLTARPHPEKWLLNLELGVAYSRVGAIRGVGASLGYLRVDRSVDGVAAGLFWTRAGDVRGIEGAVLVAEGYGVLKGIGFASIVNLRDGNVEGLQSSAVVATANDVQGIVGAGIVAVGRDVQGFEGSAGVSVARNVTGMQLGAVNVARRVNGLQLGLVNVADEVNGGALGLVSISRNGRFQPTTWVSGSSFTAMAGYKCVTGFSYTQVGIGYEPGNDYYRWDVSAGAHLNLGRGFYGEAGLGYDQTRATPSEEEIRQQVRFDARVGFEPVRGVTPFVGGSLARRVTGDGADFRGEYALGVSFL